jgi:hypothetical protein
MASQHMLDLTGIAPGECDPHSMATAVQSHDDTDA